MTTPERMTAKVKKAPAKHVAGRTAHAHAPEHASRHSATSRHPIASKFSALEHYTGIKAHDLVTKGLSVVDAKRVMATFHIIKQSQLYDVLGITPKTMQRRSASPSKALDANASDRALRLVSVTRQAIEVLGSQEAAENWLASPAMGLDRRTPIDMLQSTEGTEMVKTLLTRMDYGVYA